MAALRPCPSEPVVGVSSQLSRSTSPSPRIVRPLGGRVSASLLNLRTSTARTAHRHAIGARKLGRHPDDEKRLITNSALPIRLSQALDPTRTYHTNSLNDFTTHLSSPFDALDLTSCPGLASIRGTSYKFGTVRFYH